MPITSWSDNKIYRVGLALGEPFVIAKEHGYEGISIDLWKALADRLHIKYQFIPMSQHVDNDIKQLANGQIDILIGTVIPTAERVRLVDFTNPYYLNQIKIVVPKETISFSEVMFTIFNNALGLAVLFIIGFFILYIHLFWFFESKKAYMNLKPTYWSGIKTSFWINVLGISISSIPTHAYTRLFRLLWLIIIALLLSTVTATVTSSLTIALSNNVGKQKTLSELKYELLAAVVDAAPLHIAKEAGLDIKPVNSRKEAIDLLLSSKVAGFVESAPIADYYLRKHSLTDKLILANVVVQQNSFAIALPINSPIRHELDVQLGALQSLGGIYLICKKYLGEGTAENCSI